MTHRYPLYFALTLSLLSLSATAQSRWNVGLSVGAGLTGRHFDRPSPYSIAGGFREVFRPRLAQRFGVRMSYRLSPHFSLETGLEHQTMRDKFQRNPDTKDPLWYREPKWTFYIARRLQIPLQLRYRFTKKPQSAYLLAGVMPAYLVYLEAEYQDRMTYVIDLDMPPRSQSIHPKGYLPRYQVPVTLGVGCVVRKRIGLELAYQYMPRPMLFLPYDPGSTNIGLGSEKSWMNRGVFLTTTYWFSKRS